MAEYFIGTGELLRSTLVKQKEKKDYCQDGLNLSDGSSAFHSTLSDDDCIQVDTRGNSSTDANSSRHLEFEVIF